MAREKEQTNFWKGFVSLCKDKGKSPSSVLRALNLANGNLSAWKTGRIPRQGTLDLIANYFGVSNTFLLSGGNTEKLLYEDEELNRVFKVLTGTYPEIKSLLISLAKTDPNDVYIILQALRLMIS